MNDMKHSFKLDRTKYKDIRFVSYLLHIIVFLKLSSNRGNKMLIDFCIPFHCYLILRFWIICSLMLHSLLCIFDYKLFPLTSSLLFSEI